MSSCSLSQLAWCIGYHTCKQWGRHCAVADKGPSQTVWEFKWSGPTGCTPKRRACKWGQREREREVKFLSRLPFSSPSPLWKTWLVFFVQKSLCMCYCSSVLWISSPPFFSSPHFFQSIRTKAWCRSRSLFFSPYSIYALNFSSGGTFWKWMKDI